MNYPGKNVENFSEEAQVAQTVGSTPTVEKLDSTKPRQMVTVRLRSQTGP